VLLAAPLAALGLLSVASAGSFPGTNGLIAFTCDPGVCTATSDGTVYGQPLVSSASDPSWSPDGTKLAFVKGGDLYTSNADGTSQTLLVSGATQPSWGKNGTIAYILTSDKHVYSRTSGGTQTAITTGSTTTEADPAYSPDGTTLAYASKAGTGNYDIYVTGTATPVVATGANDLSPSWSPDGTKLVFTSGDKIETVLLSNGTITDLNVSGVDPSWSPDGSQIVYSTVADQDLAVMNANGSNPHSINTFYTTSGSDWGSVQPPSSGGGGDTGNGPKNTAYPAITLATGDSSPVVGHTMFASVGSWSPAFGNTYTYQWKRCDPGDPVNGSCFNIAGATSSSYTPVPADFNYRIRVAVTASNSSGRTSQNSEVTAPTIAIAVKLRATPQITPGPPQQTVVDTPLSLTAGTWDGSTPIAFTYSWRRCNPVGDLATCVPIVGATSSTYTPTVADIGFSLRVWITGSNLAGTDTGITNHTYPVVDKPHFSPSIVSAPNIAGTALPGRQLTANIGSFKGDSPIATSFHWYRCDANGTACHAIPSATKVVYYPTANDVGYTLRLFVFATNAYGKLLAQSDPTVAIAATPPHVKGKRIVGTSHADYLAGGGHDDVIIGLAGNDTLLGGAGDDRLDGGPGNDVITGGSGADTILGGPGSDTINAVDGERDVIDCGDGNDHAIVDAFDIVKNCEVVDQQTQTAP
jgi:Ca2+-binding RTX toxin-like protein